MLLDTVTVEVKGLNFEKLINKLNNYFVIYNLERPELKKIKFEIKQNCLKKMFSVIDTKCYTINVLKQSTFKTLYNTILYRIGLIIGLVCFVTFLIAFSNVTFSY